MFKPRDFPRSEWTEPITADAPLDEDEVELIFDEPTHDDLAGLFEDLISTIPEYDDLADGFKELID